MIWQETRTPKRQKMNRQFRKIPTFLPKQCSTSSAQSTILVSYEAHIINLIDTYETNAPRIRLKHPRTIPFWAFTQGRVSTPEPSEVVTKTKIIPLREPLQQYPKYLLQQVLSTTRLGLRAEQEMLHSSESLELSGQYLFISFTCRSGSNYESNSLLLFLPKDLCPTLFIYCLSSSFIS